MNKKDDDASSYLRDPHVGVPASQPGAARGHAQVDRVHSAEVSQVKEKIQRIGAQIKMLNEAYRSQMLLLADALEAAINLGPDEDRAPFREMISAVRKRHGHDRSTR